MRRMLLVVGLCVIMAGTWAGERTSPFVQEARTEFTTAQGLPDNRVLDIALDGQGTPMALTAGGLAVFQENQWKAVAPAAPFAGKLIAQGSDAFYAAADGRLAALRDGAWQEYPGLPAAPVNALLAQTDSPGCIVGTDAGLFLLKGGAVAPVMCPATRILSLAHGPDGALVVGAPMDLFEFKEGAWTSLFPSDAAYRWAPRDVRAVAFDKAGNLWFGAQQGAGVRRGGAWQLFTGKEGLPWNGFVRGCAGDGDAVWFATDRGAIRADGTRFNFRFSKRWLPADAVAGIAVQADGTAWFATPSGVGRIVRDAMTLDEKADYFTMQVEARHNRNGFIAQCELKERFNPQSWQPSISDNDGLYTAMYGAAQAFRFAATKDPAARELAQRSMERLAWLVSITGSGMPARVIIPADFPEKVNEIYSQAMNEKMRQNDPFWKLIYPRFVETPDKKYLWKCDTSTDELSGHFFYYAVYYDLVAETEEQKELVRKTVRAVTDHLITNGFMLKDYDGKPTRWGDLSPGYVNGFDGWAQRGLNSMMMLSMLSVAEHVTGDAKYAQAAQELREKYRYHLNAMHSKEFFPPENVVPWDNNLCLLSWYALLRYETNPELMMMWRISLDSAWLHISKQKNALWNGLFYACAKHFQEKAKAGMLDPAFPAYGPLKTFLVNKYTPFDAKVADSLESLRGIPLDLIGYEMDNRDRLDVVLDNTPGVQQESEHHRGAYGWHTDGRALPIEERGHVRLDRDAFVLNASEGGGNSEHEGTFFLLPYWLGVHAGMIE